MRAVAERALVRALPLALARRFDPRSAAGLEATFELRVPAAGGDAARFTLHVARGACRVLPEPPERPGATVEISAGDIARLGAGVAAWPQLLSAHRLRLEGDPFLALRFPALFRLPAG